jgi:hypothetical protein
MTTDPERRARLVPGLVAVAVVLGLAAWWWLRPAASAPEAERAPGPGPARIVPRVDAPGEAPGSAAPLAPPRAEVPRAPPPPRTELTRPASPRAEAPRSIAQPPPGRAQPTDRRGGSNPRAQHELETLSYGFETLDEDIQACLDQWTALDPEKTPEVMIGFELDRSGLTRSFVENAEDVPFGPRSCLSNAVYGLDWSNIVEQPAKVTKRFTVTARDAGAP